MAEVKVKCPYCGSEEVVFYGKNSTGKQRMLCKNPACAHKTFQLEYTYIENVRVLPDISYNHKYI